MSGARGADPVLRRSSAHVLVGDVRAPVLDADAAHHLVRVLRLRDGDAVTVTDGAGSWRPCMLDGDRLAVWGDVVHVPRPEPVLTLAVAPPKGDRLDWLVAKATEVGIDRIVLLEADRSVVRLRAERAARQLERLRRIITEAAMQSRRVWLPVVEGPEPARPWLAAASTAVAEPGGRPIGPRDSTVAVGPEGGWSDDELAVVDEGRTVSLGSNVLRVETAAVAAAVLMTSQQAGVGAR